MRRSRKSKDKIKWSEHAELLGCWLSADGDTLKDTTERIKKANKV